MTKLNVKKYIDIACFGCYGCELQIFFFKTMENTLSLNVYLVLVFLATLGILLATVLFPSNKSAPAKFLPYESGIQTETHLLKKRFPLRHYLVALIFLVFDIEVIFMYPWAVIAKKIGPFAFYEMIFFLAALLIGFLYVWRKRGLQWE
jgi:NADH:ubiquinone oxidoreductase subunit 3 (subunit A)